MPKLADHITAEGLRDPYARGLTPEADSRVEATPEPRRLEAARPVRFDTTCGCFVSHCTNPPFTCCY